MLLLLLLPPRPLSPLGIAFGPAPTCNKSTQVGDGTTSVIILAGEMLAAAEPFLERNLHPTTIIRCAALHGRAFDRSPQLRLCCG